MTWIACNLHPRLDTRTSNRPESAALEILTMRIFPLLLALTVAAPPSAAAAQQGHDHAAHHPRPAAQQAGPDSAFAAVQARGREAMGVDQYTSTHRFDALPDGGRIELQRDTSDAEGIATIRAHLRAIADAFARGDFATPAFVHDEPVPGTAVMAARRAAIRYEYRDLPRGGEVRIVTNDPEAVRAIHAFMAFQRGDHRAGGVSP
jgi:hypothetical protein